MIKFSLRLSRQSLTEPSGFVTGTIGEATLLLLSSMIILSCNILRISCFNLSSITGEYRYGRIRNGSAPSIVSIVCSNTDVRPRKSSVVTRKWLSTDPKVLRSRSESSTSVAVEVTELVWYTDETSSPCESIIWRPAFCQKSYPRISSWAHPDHYHREREGSILIGQLQECITEDCKKVPIGDLQMDLSVL